MVFQRDERAHERGAGLGIDDLSPDHAVFGRVERKYAEKGGQQEKDKYRFLVHVSLYFKFIF